MIGFPSVGKSTLLNALTNANSKVAAYEFTTLDVVPGLLEYKQAKIQILDVPGIVRGAADGTGRGKEVLAVVRSADLVIILLDINSLNHLKVLEKELFDVGVRLNQKKPDVKIRKTPRGGISINSTVPVDVDKKTFEAILHEYKIMNADVLIRSPINDDQIIDCINGNRKYVPGLVVINKIDNADDETVEAVKKQYPDAVLISAVNSENLEMVKDKIFQKLNFIRIYLKEPGKQPDLADPMIMTEGSTLRKLCEKLHKDFVLKFRFARIWGKSAKYDGQKIINIDKEIKDKDVVELHIK
jgi:hypothetical protein